MAATNGERGDRSAARSALHAARTLATLSLLHAAGASAGDWKVTPDVAFNTHYTDNVTLAADGAESAAWVMQVTPGIKASYEGARRLKFNLDYRLTGTQRFVDSGEDSGSGTHQLSATGQAELIDDWLFLDADARVGQQNVSFTGRQSIDDVTAADNRATVRTLSVNPYVKRRLGSYGTLEGGYTRREVSASTGSSASRDTLKAGFNSGAFYDDTNWTVNFLRDENRSDTAGDSTLQRLTADATHAITRRFALTGQVGYDSNDYSSRSSTRGPSWNGGFRWSPSRRTSVGANVGRRFFGKTFGADISHRYRRGRLELKYSEDVRDALSSIDVAGLLVSYDCFGLVNVPPVFVIGGDSATFVPTVITLVDATGSSVDCIASELDTTADSIVSGVFLSKSLRGTATFETLRHKFALSLSTSDREFQASPADDSARITLTGAWTWKFSARTEGKLTLSQSLTEAQAGAADSDLWYVSWGLSHDFTPKVQGDLTVQHQERNALATVDEYEENRVTAKLNLKF